MDVDQMRRLRRLLEIADDDEDDEPDISAGVGKKRLHDMNSRLTPLIRAIGPVRTITMKQSHLYGYFVSFIYDSPGSIEVIVYDDGRIDVATRFQRAEGGENSLRNKKALAQRLELATGMSWDWAGLGYSSWNNSGTWYKYRGPQQERYMEIVDLLTQPEAQQLFTWSNNEAVVFNR